MDSFETSLAIPCLGEESLAAVFIRAPLIESLGPAVAVLALQDNLLVGTFHPELTSDLRLHRFSLNMIGEKNNGR